MQAARPWCRSHREAQCAVSSITRPTRWVQARCQRSGPPHRPVHTILLWPRCPSQYWSEIQSRSQSLLADLPCARSRAAVLLLLQRQQRQGQRGQQQRRRCGWEQRRQRQDPRSQRRRSLRFSQWQTPSRNTRVSALRSRRQSCQSLLRLRPQPLAQLYSNAPTRGHLAGATPTRHSGPEAILRAPPCMLGVEHRCNGRTCHAMHIVTANNNRSALIRSPTALQTMRACEMIRGYSLKTTAKVSVAHYRRVHIDLPAQMF